MKFEEVFPECRDNSKLITRKGWNASNQYVQAIDSRCWKIHPDVIGNFPETNLLVLKNAQNKISAWIPSMGDLYADDWCILDK